MDTERVVDVAGLGMLATPAWAQLKKRPGAFAKAMRKEKWIAVSEVAGLGTLAAPSLIGLARRRKKKK